MPSVACRRVKFQQTFVAFALPIAIHSCSAKNSTIRNFCGQLRWSVRGHRRMPALHNGSRLPPLNQRQCAVGTFTPAIASKNVPTPKKINEDGLYILPTCLKINILYKPKCSQLGQLSRELSYFWQWRRRHVVKRIPWFTGVLSWIRNFLWPTWANSIRMVGVIQSMQNDR